MTILITIGYVGFFIAQDAKLTALAQRPTGKVESTFRIHADELQFSGTTITGFAVMPNRERVRLTWFCREEATFRQLQTTHVGYVVTGAAIMKGSNHAGMRIILIRLVIGEVGGLFISLL
ncbi:hypothetical protein ACU6W1_07360 [Weissella cibaria]